MKHIYIYKYIRILCEKCNIVKKYPFMKKKKIMRFIMIYKKEIIYNLICY